MGESEKAGNKGVPGTPRDGAAIEITGLRYSALTWIEELREHGQYPQRSLNGRWQEYHICRMGSKIK